MARMPLCPADILFRIVPTLKPTQTHIALPTLANAPMRTALHASLPWRNISLSPPPLVLHPARPAALQMLRERSNTHCVHYRA